MADPAAPTTTPLPQPTPGQAPHATHDLKYHSTHHIGFDEVVALVRHGKPAPARVAELMTQRPGDQRHILEYLHQHLGNHYVNEVKAALHSKSTTNAAKVDLDMRKLNPHDQGTTQGGAADPNRLVEHPKAHPEGVKAHLVTETSIYKNDGTAYPIGKAPAGQEVQLNAGGAKQITIAELDPAHPTDCVMAFYIGPADQHVTGWIPRSVLDATGAHLAQVDQSIAKKIDHKHKDLKFAHTAKKVKAVGRPAEFADLRTAAHQGDSANLPDHYYARPGNVVNLLSNVPGSGSTKFGVALDVLVENTVFHEATPRLVDHTQLFKKASADLTDQAITFVYGKAQIGNQAPSYGWINAACLV